MARPRGKEFQSTITKHPDRARIERDLALGRPLRVISKKYGISITAAFRHKKKLPPQLKAALAGHALRPAEAAADLSGRVHGSRAIRPCRATCSRNSPQSRARRQISRRICLSFRTDHHLDPDHAGIPRSAGGAPAGFAALWRRAPRGGGYPASGGRTGRSAADGVDYGTFTANPGGDE
jgi:hypothetical protein